MLNLSGLGDSPTRLSEFLFRWQVNKKKRCILDKWERLSSRASVYAADAWPGLPKAVSAGIVAMAKVFEKNESKNES